MSLSHEVGIPVTLDGNVEVLIYAPNNTQIDIENAKLIPAASESKQAVNFTTIQLLDKGVDGAQNDEISSIKTEDVAEGVALVTNVKQDISPSSFYTSGNAVTIKKVDAGTTINLGACVLVMKVRGK
jgi:hypothetical protein